MQVTLAELDELVAARKAAESDKTRRQADAAFDAMMAASPGLTPHANEP